MKESNVTEIIVSAVVLELRARRASLVAFLQARAYRCW
jgi:hypothetical protein